MFCTPLSIYAYGLSLTFALLCWLALYFHAAPEHLGSWCPVGQTWDGSYLQFNNSDWKHMQCFLDTNGQGMLSLRLHRVDIYIGPVGSGQATWILRSRHRYAGYLRFGPIENKYCVFVTLACARRTGAASQAFERMHNTLSHRSKT
jgi:hypothetical protein